jgi:hypothetical protein
MHDETSHFLCTVSQHLNLTFGEHLIGHIHTVNWLHNPLILTFWIFGVETPEDFGVFNDDQ